MARLKTISDASMSRISKAVRAFEQSVTPNSFQPEVWDRMVGGATRFRLLSNMNDDEGTPAVRMAMSLDTDNKPIWFDLDQEELLYPGAEGISSLEEGTEVFAVQTDTDLWAIIGGGSGGVQVVRFVILSADCEACYAIAKVVSRPPGGLTDQTDFDPGYMLGYYDKDIILAVDLVGCFLNAPAVDLVGAMGYAALLHHEDYEHDRCAIGGGKRWEILSLCCTSNSDCGSGTA